MEAAISFPILEKYLQKALAISFESLSSLSFSVIFVGMVKQLLLNLTICSIPFQISFPLSLFVWK